MRAMLLLEEQMNLERTCQAERTAIGMSSGTLTIPSIPTDPGAAF